MSTEIKQKLGLPIYQMLEFGNIFSGSKGKLNYKLSPKDDILFIKMNLSNMPGSEVSNEFPLTVDGYTESCYWMAEQYKIFEPKI